MKKSVTRRIDQETNVYQDKGFQKTLYRDLNPKRLRNTDIAYHNPKKVAAQNLRITGCVSLNENEVWSVF